MPPYKLLVEYQRKEIDRRFRKFITDNEIVRDEPFSFTLKLTNIGREPFPGGTISTMRMDLTALVALSVSWGIGKLDKIPPLPPEGFYETGPFSAALSWEGPTRVVFNLKPDDSAPLELYWNKEGNPFAADWIHVVYSVGRESVLALDLLDKISRRQEQPPKKES